MKRIPFALVLLLTSSIAHAAPAMPAAGRGWMIVVGCTAVLAAVLGSFVAACRLVERRQRRRAGLCVAVVLILAAPARADEPAPAPQPAPVLVAAPALPPVVAPVPLTDAERIALAVRAAQAGLVAAQQGIQGAPVLKSWSDTRAGQVVLGCIAGAIVVTSAAGAVAGVWVAAR